MGRTDDLGRGQRHQFMGNSRSHWRPAWSEYPAQTCSLVDEPDLLPQLASWNECLLVVFQIHGQSRQGDAALQRKVPSEVDGRSDSDGIPFRVDTPRLRGGWLVSRSQFGLLCRGIQCSESCRCCGSARRCLPQPVGNGLFCRFRVRACGLVFPSARLSIQAVQPNFLAPRSGCDHHWV